MKKGFTLAEVLITLAIIGVVAAMTIPTLIFNTQNKQFATMLRKKQAEFIQVLKLSVVYNGDMSGWDWSMDTDSFVSKYFAPYLKISNCGDCWTAYTFPKGLWFEQPAYAGYDNNDIYLSDEEQINCYTSGTGTYCSQLISACQAGFGDASTTARYLISSGVYIHASGAEYCQAFMNGGYIAPADEPEVTYSLPDGTQVGFYKQDVKSVLFVYFDLNGTAKPNKYGVDKYVMVMAGNTLAFWGEGESDLTSGDYGCSDSGNGMYCGALLKKNNWQFTNN